VPENRKQLQRFLGFAHFYRRFIQDFSKVAAPLTKLISTARPFSWSTEAAQAFLKLKTLFTTAPVLIHPDPTRQFIVEVDASDNGVGAVLSQYSNQKLHPCVYFSRRLSPAECNYDVGNRELLAVVLALAEWRHWLEGCETPFIVWTDHKNLTYLRNAKRLNSRQARWALFLGQSFLTDPVPVIVSLMPYPAKQRASYPMTHLSLFSLLAALWEQPIGRWSSRLRRPSPVSLALVMNHLIACLFQKVSGLRCCSGGIPPTWLATLELHVHLDSYANGSGGPRWAVIPRSLWQPVPSVPKGKILTNDPLVY